MKRKLYASVVNKQLLYGAPFWMGSISSFALKRMASVQRYAALRVASWYRTVVQSRSDSCKFASHSLTYEGKRRDLRWQGQDTSKSSAIREVTKRMEQQRRRTMDTQTGQRREEVGHQKTRSGDFSHNAVAYRTRLLDPLPEALRKNKRGRLCTM